LGRGVKRAIIYKSMRRWALISLLILGVLAAGIFWSMSKPAPVFIENYQEPVYEEAVNGNVNVEKPVAPVVDKEEVTVIETIPKEPTELVEHSIKILPVPFTVQAPYANWDLPYQEACEEASIIMLVDFVLGRDDLRLTPEEADERILELVQWETDNGYTIDITAQEVTQVLNERFGVRAEVVSYSVDAIKQQINLGKPVILPAAGRLLGNPYFRTPGPLYHMLVVKGYEGDEFITNDPGTRRGENFRYHYSAFDRAVHDWNGGEVESGEQVMIVLK